MTPAGCVIEAEHLTTLSLCFLKVLTVPAFEGCCEEYKISVKHVEPCLPNTVEIPPPSPPPPPPCLQCDY